MEGLLTPEDVRLLSEWAVDVSDGAGAELRLIVDDSALTASPEPTKRPRKKKYRSTYLRTREAKEGLQDEIEALESRLEVLKRRAGLEGDRSSFEQSTVLNAVMRGVVQQQHMVMASTHTSLVKRLSEQATHPLYTPVHLGKDWESRRQTMIAIKSAKLRTVSQYLMERTKDLDEQLPHSSQDVTHDAEGNIICSQFDMVQFTGVKSLREVFDAILYFSHHEEIVLSEHLGVLAIRDNFDVADMIAVNSRMYWIDNNGVTTEWNSVNFAQLFDENYAVLACDNVDVDARYPYHPSSRVRRDFSGGIMLSVAKQSEDDSLVVVMRRASIIKIHRPKFPLSAAAVASLVKNVNGWEEAQMASIRSQIDSTSPESPASSPVM